MFSKGLYINDSSYLSKVKSYDDPVPFLLFTLKNPLNIDYKESIFNLITEASLEISESVKNGFYFSDISSNSVKIQKRELLSEVSVFLFEDTVKKTKKKDILSSLRELNPLNHFEILNFFRILKLKMDRYSPIFGSLINLRQKPVYGNKGKKIIRIPIISSMVFNQEEFDNISFNPPFYIFAR